MQAFLDALPAEKLWCQILIERQGAQFHLRHVEDRSRSPGDLKSLSIPDLRKLAMFDAAGQFRPLRAAPDLRSGWICDCRSPEELWRALQELYPGSVPDWYATQSGPPPVTNYRAFTDRQSGMYRITQHLSDAQAAHVIAACCPAKFCLKRRLWTVEGLAPDAPESKSAIPCLEPCAVLLELARKAARIEQEEKAGVQPSDLETLLAAAKSFLEHGKAADRIGNVGSPTNPRRLQLVLEKHAGAVNGSENRED
jgi:sirohydrochlorin cobaltochelatase